MAIVAIIIAQVHWVGCLISIVLIMLFIADRSKGSQTQLTMRPYHISEVAELCVKYKERKSFLMDF